MISVKFQKNCPSSGNSQSTVHPGNREREREIERERKGDRCEEADLEVISTEPVDIEIRCRVRGRRGSIEGFEGFLQRLGVRGVEKRRNCQRGW